MKTKKYYLLPRVETSLKLRFSCGNCGNLEHTIKAFWYEGQKGAVSAFTNRRVAQRVAKKLGIPGPLIVVETASK